MVALILFSTIASGFLLSRSFFNTLLDETELRAITLIEGIAQAVQDDIAHNRLDRIDRSMVNLRQGNEGNADVIFVAISDSNNYIITREVSAGYESLLTHEFMARAAISEKRLRQLVTVNDSPVVLVSIPIITKILDNQGIRWGTIVGGLDIQRIQDSIFPIIESSAIIVVGVLIISTLFILLILTYNLLLPMKKLSETATSFAGGDLSARVPFGSMDEVGRLGVTFNSMAGDIEKHTRSLEESVRNRTQQLEEANAKLSELAMVDELTGLGNRRTLTSTLKMEFKRSRRDGASISLMMIDVDHFKNYNDTHGHPEGDEVLRKIGAILRNRLRGTDIPCRYGGEEFAAILIATDYENAGAVAEGIRKRIEEEDFNGEESQPLGTLTVSIGVATFPNDADSPDSLIKAADVALYRAKEGGRNLVLTYKPEMARPGSNGYAGLIKEIDL